ncbi:hypothetical protein F5148DRAFT_120171 [Russula earlei]|uniref:Uncharacterized protein n=1 Tax=Russula earlei TaxID=71964 RepID=A0ACC0U8E1_9AGAM|nr:hypothetical protein F5148DRAFT_120171 [Russula earlei]
MYHRFHDVDQYSWSEIPDIPFIFPPSPIPSDCSRAPPQMQLAPYGISSTPFDKNRSKGSQDFYAPPCAAIADLPGRGDVWNALIPSQLYSANAGLPPGSQGQTLHDQQFAFGEAPSPFTFSMDNVWPAPLAFENYVSAPITPPSVPGPSPVPHLPPLPPLPPPPPTDRTSFSPISRLDDPTSLAYPAPPEPISTPGDSPRPKHSQVSAAPPKPRSTPRSSRHPIKKKRKSDQPEAVSDDGSTMLQCCMTVKPESLARHLKSDGHKRNAGLPLDRPEACSFCNIAFARQDARNRHFRSQHGGKSAPDARTAHVKIKRPSATHPSLLPRKRK